MATGSARILEGRHAGAATHQPDDDAPPVSTLGRAAAPLIAAGRRKNRGDDGPRVRLSRGGPHRTRRPAASAWCGGRTAGWGQGGLTLTIAAVACGLEHERAVGGAAWRTFSRLAGACGGAASPARVQTAAWLSRILGRGGALAASRVRPERRGCPAQLCSAVLCRTRSPSADRRAAGLLDPVVLGARSKGNFTGAGTLQGDCSTGFRVCEVHDFLTGGTIGLDVRLMDPEGFWIKSLQRSMAVRADMKSFRFVRARRQSFRF